MHSRRSRPRSYALARPILRVCGKDVSLVFEKTYTVDGFKDDKREMTEAFFGLVPASDGGFWAITSGALYHFGADGTKKEEYALPKLKPVSAFILVANYGVIVVRTDANWAVSVSGYTPVLIPLDGRSPNARDSRCWYQAPSGLRMKLQAQSRGKLNCGKLATNSTRKVLKSSLRAHHFFSFVLNNLPT